MKLPNKKVVCEWLFSSLWSLVVNSTTHECRGLHAEYLVQLIGELKWL